MFLQGVLLVALGFFQVAISAPLEDEKIVPVDLHYYCIHTDWKGKDHQSPILLIHGITSALTNWDGVGQVLAFTTGRRVCGVDLRNHGDSPWSNQTTLEFFTADIAHFLDEQKIEKVNLIGHSLGGRISMHYTLHNPDRVDSLVVEDMRPNGITDQALIGIRKWMDNLQAAIKAVPEGSSEDDAGEFIYDFIFKKHNKMSSTEKKGAEFIAKNFPIRCMDGKCKYKANVDILQKLVNEDVFLPPETKGLYEGKTLVVYGKKSAIDVGGDEENIRKLFPKVKFVGVEGAGHSIHETFPEFLDAVIEFFKN